MFLAGQMIVRIKKMSMILSFILEWAEEIIIVGMKMALGNWWDFYNEGPGMVADDMQKYLEKWGVK